MNEAHEMTTGTTHDGGHEAVRTFAEDIADYVETHRHYEVLNKREAVIQAVNVLLTDIGAAQAFCREIGLDVDLHAKPLLREQTWTCACGRTERHLPTIECEAIPPTGARPLVHQALGRCRCGAGHSTTEALYLNHPPSNASSPGVEK